MRVVKKVEFIEWHTVMDPNEATVFLKLLQERKKELEKFVELGTIGKDRRDEYYQELLTVNNMLTSFELHREEEL